MLGNFGLMQNLTAKLSLTLFYPGDYGSDILAQMNLVIRTQFSTGLTQPATGDTFWQFEIKWIAPNTQLILLFNNTCSWRVKKSLRSIFTKIIKPYCIWNCHSQPLSFARALQSREPFPFFGCVQSGVETELFGMDTG